MMEQILEGLEAISNAMDISSLYALGQEGTFESDGNEAFWSKVELNGNWKEVYRMLGIDVSVERTNLTELDNFSPEDYENTDAIYGHPERATDYWEWQDGPTCALHAQRAIIEEVTGQDISVDDMKAIAEAYGWYTDGTPIEHMNKMLEYCGIPNEAMYGMTYEQLRESVFNGERVITAVDSDEYWYGEYDNLFEGERPDHAIEVIGFDESDPENPMVIVNDSGVPNGRGLRIPADTFREAWEDSGNFAIRVPVYGEADYSSEGAEAQSGEGSAGANIGYSSKYYRHNAAGALKNGRRIAFEDNIKYAKRAAAKEQEIKQQKKGEDK